MSGKALKPAIAASWAQLTLAPAGRSLVEASAGTGKTWTIAMLYLRILLEQEFTPQQIIVTTFTNAAAQELGGRIRARIEWALQCANALLAGDGKANAAARDEDAGRTPDQVWLDGRWRRAQGVIDKTRVRADRNRLRIALAELDLAPIGTLHSVCRRILNEFPLECGVGFGIREMVDGAALRGVLFDDLWRHLEQSTGDLDDEDAAAWAKGRKRLNSHLKLLLAPGVKIEAPSEQRIAKLMDAGNAQRIRAWVGSAPWQRSNAALASRLRELADFIEAKGIDVEPAGKLGKELARLIAEPLDKFLKPDDSAEASWPAIRDIASEAARLLPCIADLPFLRALTRYQAKLGERLRAQLARNAQLSFDEVIARVHEALQGADSVLAQRLCQRWPVALVDEFQDTDGLQYGILDRIYRASERKLRGHLLMIGDPKQAIYRFRGGDIDAYLDAGKSATEILKLTVNFRSSQALVGALNAWYAASGEVLSSNDQHGIRYETVSAHGLDARYTIAGKDCRTPLHLHVLPLADTPESQDERRALALAACAAQIVELLSGRHRIGAALVQPGDIAVLLPRHADIVALRTLLAQCKVPCVSSGREDVFASPWVTELRVVLYALLHPRDEGVLRAALATRLWGLDWQGLRALATDDAAWQREVARAHELDAMWQKQGVLAVVLALIGRAGARLCAASERERALTDLRQLGELLQMQAHELHGRDLLLEWLADQSAGDAVGEEAAGERQLRIESDAARVQLMTLHASKGLEFNVVMLPLQWANIARGSEIPVLHEQGGQGRVMRFDAEAAAQQAQQDQEERHRLLYVALTRARHAVHVYALPPARSARKGGKFALADPQRAPLDAQLERVLSAGKAPKLTGVDWDDDAWPIELRGWTRAVEASPIVSALRLEPAGVPLEYRWSFSALARAGAAWAGEERAASDEFETMADSDVDDSADGEGGEVEHPDLAWLAPIAGTDFGNAVHAIFEHRRIGQPLSEQQTLVRQCLRDARVDLHDRAPDEVVRHLVTRLQGSLDAALLPGIDDTLTLAALPAQALRAEMEFDFRLDAVSLRRLHEVCDFVPGGSQHDLNGLMNGKIDLVFEHRGRFHVLDYKTNRAGDGRLLSGYAPQRIEAIMAQHHYPFQALLYTLALERYLRQRLHEYQRARHLGHTIYLFVRAAGLAPQAGIWARRFDDRLLDAVDAVFAGAWLEGQPA
ncbi:UvrD-helicase domain-containing protein [Dokdonella sp.]|uniref:UvrD-helicase domain-containing protein n=1 Tax=Dokdonella sp. TaxID=2291710 RepID=UPI0025B9E277|nr:UvrD-helicase domain-containing protein [Dokdonella sp.]MBX3688346.1 UvrD-helicase domain-containing protein [Dokdonella sp.]